MLISICIPDKNRTHYLKQTLDSRIEAARNAPPVEICIVNYNSDDDLDEYIKSVECPIGVSLNYRHYQGRNKYYHNSHAANLAMTLGNGEYLLRMGCDHYLKPDAIKIMRDLICDHDYDFMHGTRYQGIILIRRELFYAAGGYDERIELYGNEDRELNARVMRHPIRFGYFPWKLIEIIHTPNEEKTKSYRIKGNKTQHSRKYRWVLEESEAQQTLVANQGREWAQWI